MSWDIFVMNLPRDAKTFEEIPEGFEFALLVERSKIVAKIKEVVPTADFSDPSWGLIDGGGWSIEVNLGDEEECDSFAFHVRGGDAAACVVTAILEHLNLRAVDSSTGGFFVGGPEAVASFSKWRAYRDQVVSAGNDDAGSGRSQSKIGRSWLHRLLKSLRLSK